MSESLCKNCNAACCRAGVRMQFRYPEHKESINFMGGSGAFLFLADHRESYGLTRLLQLKDDCCNLKRSEDEQEKPEWHCGAYENALRPQACADMPEGHPYCLFLRFKQGYEDYFLCQRIEQEIARQQNWHLVKLIIDRIQPERYPNTLVDYLNDFRPNDLELLLWRYSAGYEDDAFKELLRYELLPETKETLLLSLILEYINEGKYPQELSEALECRDA